MRSVVFALVLVLAACSQQAELLPPDGEPAAPTCVTDSDCLPCGDGCIHSSMAPVTLCMEATHDGCVCIDSVCVRK